MIDRSWYLGLRRWISALAFFMAFLLPSKLHAQNGGISGSVRDASDAVVPKAKLKLTNQAAGFSRATESNTSGVYSFASVPPGTYDLSVAAEGFESQNRTGVTLNAASSVQMDFVLNVGNIETLVTVEAIAEAVNRTDASVGTVVNRQFVENLPLNGRSFQSLITLTPGVVLTRATENNPGQFSVNGQRPDANYFTVDGVGANLGIIPDTVLNQVGGGAVPATTASGGLNNLVSIDALQEFRVMTSTYAPEYGRTPGGQIQIVTRSGTNAFHGSVFEYFRNSVLDANNWFANQNHLAKPAERQNDFGGVFGGPLVNDRTFFFFSYEGLRLVQPVATTIMVPSVTARQQAIPAMRPCPSDWRTSQHSRDDRAAVWRDQCVAAGCGLGHAVLSARFHGSRWQTPEPRCIYCCTGEPAGESRPQCVAWIWHESDRFHAAAPIFDYGAAQAAGPSRIFQYVQPSQFRC